MAKTRCIEDDAEAHAIDEIIPRKITRQHSESEKENPRVFGSRIIDMEVLANGLDSCKTCEKGPLVWRNFVREDKKGAASVFQIKCEHCGAINKVLTSKQHKTGKRRPMAYDINTRIALGALNAGIGQTHVNSTSPIRCRSGSREIEHVNKIHEQIEIHLNGCWEFALPKILVLANTLVRYSVYIHSKSKLTYTCTSRSRKRLHLQGQEQLEAKYHPERFGNGTKVTASEHRMPASRT